MGNVSWKVWKCREGMCTNETKWKWEDQTTMCFGQNISEET